MEQTSDLLEKRDAKVIPHLIQYAPVWIMDEKIILDEEAIQFNVVFSHNLYGWVNRRYRYDGADDVLYHKGQTRVEETQIIEITEQPPFVSRIVANIPNAYGG